MAGTYWLTILPDTSKLKPAINAAMRGEKITADFGIDEAKARKAGRDAAAAAEQEANKAKPKVRPTADVPASRRAGQDAADEAAKPVEQKRPKVHPQPDLPGSRKAGEQAGESAASGMIGSLKKLAPMLGGLSILGGLKSSLTEGMDFTAALNTMGGVLKATDAQLAQVSATARQLGSDASLPGVSALTAAQAMTELAKGGFDVAQSMEAARGTLQLAGAAGIDAATAATIQADALHTFQLGAQDANRVADMLANVANASTGEVTDFAQGLAQAGAVANGFGISIEDTITSLGMFANFGIKGSDAGTLMKASLLAITDGGKPAQAAIKTLGLELYNASGQFVGYPAMMEQVAAASQRLSAEQFQAATATLFGSDAMRGSMVAAKGGVAAFDSLREAVTRQGGAADMAAAKTRGLPGAWANFQNTVDNVKLSISDMLDGPLTGLLNGLSKVPDFVSRNSGAFKILAGVITTLLVPALTLWTIAQAKAIATSIVGGIASLVGSFGKLASVLKIATAAQWLFNAAMTANPIGLIIAAVAALVAGLVYFFTKTELGQKIWKKFTDYLLGAWDSIKSAFATAWDFIGNIWDSMVTKAGEVWQGIKDKFTQVVDFVKGLPSRIGDAAKGMWDGISNAFKSMVDKLKGWWNGFASKLSWTSPEWLPGDPVTFSLPTFSRGGYTGNAGTNEVAGIVHGGEYVIKASSRERLESALPGLLDYLNKTGRLPGYYKGGRVALGNISGPGITTGEQQSMWDAIRSAFPDAVLSSATRTVMTEGHPDFHNAGRAIDLTGPNMGAMAAWIAKNFPDSLELIHSPFNRNIKNGKNVGDGTDFYGAGTMNAHADHVHWALGRNAEGSKVGAGASSSSGGGSSVGSSTSSGGSYRAATSSELKAASGRVDSASNAVTQAQQRVDDRTFTRDRAQQRLNTARAEGKDTVDEEQSLLRANRELDDATQNLADKRDKLAEVEGELADLQSTGKWVEGSGVASTVSDTMTGGGQQKSGPNTGDLGQMFVGGLLESIGLDGSLFSNPMEWPSIKSLMAGINWAGGLLSIAGATPESMGAASGGGTAGGFAAGAADAVGLGGLLSAIPSATEMATRSGSPALAPGEFNPAVAGGTSVAATAGMSTFAPAPHGGTGGAPGPAVDNSININGNVGMDPAALQTKIRTEQNARTRSTVVR